MLCHTNQGRAPTLECLTAILCAGPRHSLHGHAGDLAKRYDLAAREIALLADKGNEHHQSDAEHQPRKHAAKEEVANRRIGGRKWCKRCIPRAPAAHGSGSDSEVINMGAQCGLDLTPAAWANGPVFRRR